MRLLARQFNRLRCAKWLIYKEPDFSCHESQHMTERDTKPEASAQVFDAVKGNWVDTKAPAWAQGYLRLSRMDRPIGTWLLLLPCWWGLLLAILEKNDPRLSDLWIFVGCAMGALLMRGAGCTWNDITDRNLDGQVARTKFRPIPSGQVRVKQALIWMFVQVALAGLILLSFQKAAIFLGVIALLPVAIYPFAKRFTWWPQAFLGIAFNWGALLGYAAHSGGLGWPAFLLYFAGIAWTLFYDTIYAHQDTEDDALIGIKSTARLFGDDSFIWLRWFTVTSGVLMVSAIFVALEAGPRVFCTFGVFAFISHLLWQMRRLDLKDETVLLTIFRSNRDAGLLPIVFFIVALIA
ncbi:MAG: 4-hydroxybenzoate octaprenyltransferase [Rhodobacteraceae bacterium]|nr:4-hydroxybenzoate octaprenyltransferase [Marinovum sp.]RZO40509.1 MAG: 4-hydroxybenzoate octaprenyltransferase [Paracoccaceae bacterium]